MGHYDENRKFDDEWRASNGPGTFDRDDPNESKIKMVKFEVLVPTEVYTPHTLHSWTDGSKWVCDTTGTFDAFKDIPTVGVRTWRASGIDAVAEFIRTYKHSVGTFYVIADYKEVVKLIIDNPKRDIRHLLVE